MSLLRKTSLKIPEIVAVGNIGGFDYLIQTQMSGEVFVENFHIPEGRRVVAAEDLIVHADTITVDGELCSRVGNPELGVDAPIIELRASEYIYVMGNVRGGEGVDSTGSQRRGGNGGSVLCRAPIVWVDGKIVAGDGGRGGVGKQGGDGGSIYLLCQNFLSNDKTARIEALSGAGGDGGFPGGGGGNAGGILTAYADEIYSGKQVDGEEIIALSKKLRAHVQGSTPKSTYVASLWGAPQMGGQAPCLDGDDGPDGADGSGQDAGHGADGQDGTASSPNGGDGGDGGDAEAMANPNRNASDGNNGNNCCPGLGGMGGMGGKGGDATGGRGGNGGNAGAGYNDPSANPPIAGMDGQPGDAGNGATATAGNGGKGGDGGKGSGGGGSGGAKGSATGGAAGTPGMCATGSCTGGTGANGQAYPGMRGAEGANADACP